MADPRAGAVTTTPGPGPGAQAPTEGQAECLRRLACELAGTEAGYVALVRDHRAEIVAARRLPADLVQFPLDQLPGARAVTSGEPLNVPDTYAEGELALHPWVRGAAGVRAILAVPVPDESGAPAGILAVLDTRARRFSMATERNVADLAATAGANLTRRLQRLDPERLDAYRAVFESASDAIILRRPSDSAILRVNPAAVRLFGAGSEAELMANASELWPAYQPDGRPSRDVVQANIAQAIAQGSYRTRWWARTLQGETFPTELILTRVDMPSGPVTHAIIRDVSDDPAATAEARDDTQTLADQLLHQLPVAFFLLDEQGVVVRWNSHVERVTGYDADRLSDQRWSALLPTAARSSATGALAEAHEAGLAALEADLPSRRHGSATYHFQLRPLTLGEVLYTSVVGVDISDRRVIERREQNRNAVLTALSRGAARHEILGRICTMVESEDPTAYCSILLMDNAGAYLRHGAAPSLSADFCAAADGIPVGPQAGSCGTAAYANEMVTVTDISASPLWAGFAHVAEDAGLRACWSLPIRDGDGRVLGTFAIYHTYPRAPSAQDYDRIATAANVASVALRMAQ